jgi:very-short-patch-repair endonuclease
MSDTEQHRLDGWLRKLLDLTLRNPLINLRPSRGLAFLRPQPQELLPALLAAEDNGVELVAFPWSDMPWQVLEDWRLDEARPHLPNLDAPVGNQEHILRDEATSRGQRRRRVSLADESWNDALSRLLGNGLLVDAVPEDLQDDLVDLDRQQRLRQQEGGVHTLYLAMGLLRWKEKGTNTNWIESPLLLVPVQLSRNNAQTAFRLSLRDDAAVFNPSLVHKLRQDFGLPLDIKLPEEGLEENSFPVMLDEVRTAVSSMPEWTLEEESRLGLFSFHKQHLWNDLAERAKEVLSHPVVGRIAGQVDDPGRHDPLVDWEKLDERFSPSELLTPLPVDASQMRALTLVDQGHNLVIDGPPGTGKSQTITNLIAHALGKGKRVLFVSEKATALSVVHDRLEELGLGPFCLDLHSSKAQKSEVVAQLRRTMDAGVAHDSARWTKMASQLHEQRLELNAAMDALHEKRPNGYSLFQAIGLWTTLAKPTSELDLAMGYVASQDAQEYAQSKKSIASWARANSMLPPSASRFLALSGRDLPEDEDFFQTVEQALTSLTVIENAFRALGLSVDTVSIGTIRNMVKTVSLALPAEFPQEWRDWIVVEGRPQQVQVYRQAKQEWSKAWAPLDAGLNQPVLGTVASWSDEWVQAQSAVWPLGWFKRRALRRALVVHSKTGQPPSNEQMSLLVQAFPVISQARSQLKKLDGDIDKKLSRWVRSRQDWEKVEVACHWAEDALEALSGAEQERLRGLLVNPPPALTPQWAGRLSDALASFDAACSQWRSWFLMGEEGWPSTGEEASLESWRRHWQEWKAARPAWPAWRHCEQSAAQLCSLGLEGLIEAATHLKMQPAQVEDAWMWSYWKTWISQVQESIGKWDALGRRREMAIEDFSMLDANVESGTRHEILARLCATWRMAERNAPATETRLLNHELGKKRAHLPPRQLLSRLPNLWPAMKPCLLMSPLSAAQHLGPDTPMFDLVVFDEASQISVADAVGVIARGKQVVVVGDPKQMPPSRLFDASDIEDEDDPLTERDLDSILDECISHMNRVLLNWHYRSRHEDLIAFSNHRYYNGELITFPSPHNREAGIVVHEVNGGYERAARRVNLAEAQAVVDAVVAHYQLPGQTKSLGVITFNQNQQRLINRMLDARRASDMGLDAALTSASEEVFVKNLETVQGDERDVIFFSTTFAPDAAGNFPMQFGPLGQLGGERRLNVAITRARHRVEIFTSFNPGQMDVAHLRHKGIKDLRDYLMFARGGEAALLSVAVPTLGVADSPFEIAVAEALEARGWSVVPQVGCSGYRIDLAVKHPDKPGEYLAGVECDGATYHSFKVARDRDRMRQRVLERLGWNILRIWSTDWWQDAAGEIDRIDEKLRFLRNV